MTRRQIVLLVAFYTMALVSFTAFADGPETITLDLGGGINMELVEVPAGEFDMGDVDVPNAIPVHTVTIYQPFYIGKYEVTQAQYEQVMGSNPSTWPGYPSRPVETLSWNDCTAFCEALSTQLHVRIRLPSEAEWEYACRAGSTTKFYFGDDPNDLDLYAWYVGNSDAHTHEVGGRLPNDFGLYDMAGNVHEYCEDTWHPNYMGAPSDGSPWTTGGEPSRIYRGGCWVDPDYYCKSAPRFVHAPTEKNWHHGFRVVLDPLERVHNITQDTWHRTIQGAIDCSDPNDEIVLSPATFTGEGNRDIDFGGKAIIVRSKDSDDPNVVAATVIRCNPNDPNDPNYDNHRGFYFHNGEDANSIVSGLTIINGHVTGANDEDPNGWGGAIACVASNPTIRNCVISGNDALVGGGICCGTNNTAKIINCTLSANSAACGGGVACVDNGDPNISNCRICGNSAATVGGGIACCDNSDPRITNCTIDLNEAGSGGGILCFVTSSPDIVNSSVLWNLASSGGGLYHIGGCSAKVANSILWGNDPDQIWSPGPSIATVTYSDVQDGTGEPWFGEGCIDADPQFTDADGPDDDLSTWHDNHYHLSPGSPCRDVGDPSLDYSGQTDVDGQPRVMPQGGGVDMGSDEYPGAPYYYLLTLQVKQEEYGHVELDPNDASLPFAYEPGTLVSLTAEAAEGKSFRRWEIYDPNYPGDPNYVLHDSNNPLTFIMDQDREVLAKFKCGSGMPLLAVVMLGVLGVFVWLRQRA